MKKLFPILIGIALIALPSMAFAGVTGTPHDLGATEGPCISCHIPHGAQGGVGEFLWPSTPSSAYSDQRNLCVTCHDGNGTEPGFATVFDANLEQHKFPTAMSIPDCSGDSACHDVHNQGASGQFLQVGLTSGSFCITCHDATPYNANTLGDHTAGTEHEMTGGFSCENCHVIHGAPTQHASGGIAQPILLSDNLTGTYYGDFCISCHLGVAPDSMAFGDTSGTPRWYGGVASGDSAIYSEILVDGNELRHPTQGGVDAITGCNECHDPHQPTVTTPTNDFILTTNNKDSEFCISCHSGALTPPAKITIGDGSTHFVGVPSSDTINGNASPALPWADEIDDDGDVGADYANTTANMMVCETCHSVHRNGVTGPTDHIFFLRHTYAGSGLCGECHTDNI